MKPTKKCIIHICAVIAILLVLGLLVSPVRFREVPTKNTVEDESAWEIEESPVPFEPECVLYTPEPPVIQTVEPIIQQQADPIIESQENDTSSTVEAVWRSDVPLSAELQSALLTICDETGMDPLLALGLIETESGFQTDAVSPWGDYGLCQLNQLYFPTDITPEENMRLGISLLARNIEQYGSVAAGLTAYNRGHDDGSRAYASVVLAKAQGWGYVYE